MSIKVFISHSTSKKDLPAGLLQKLASHARFRDKLCDTLKENGIGVIVDQDIPVGVEWAEFLLQEMAECRAAVVLVNEAALTQSDWVNAEVTVVGYRAITEGEDFLPIIVPFGGITGDQIEKHPAWKPVDITRFQMLCMEGVDPDDHACVDQVIEEIVRSIQKFIDADEADWLVHRLVSLLDLDDDCLRDVGRRLRAGIPGGAHGKSLRRKVARAVYKEGSPSIKPITEARNCRLKGSELTEVLNIVTTHWIDKNASGGLRKPFEGPYGRIVGINGKLLRYTTMAYVRHVCDSMDPWEVIHVDPGCAVSIYDQVYDSLRDHFCRGNEGEQSDPDLESEEACLGFINGCLSSPHEKPVIIAFHQEGGAFVKDLVGPVLDRFPDIRIVVCTGTPPGTSGLTDGFHMLVPEFDLKVEKRVYDEYRSAGRQFRN